MTARNKKKMFSTTVIIAIIGAYAALALSRFLFERETGAIYPSQMLAISLPAALSIIIGVIVIAAVTKNLTSVIVFLLSTVGVWSLVFSIQLASSKYVRGQIRDAVDKRQSHAEARAKGKELGRFQEYDDVHRERRFYYTDEKLHYFCFLGNKIEDTFYEDAIAFDEDEYVKVYESEINSVPCAAWRKKDYYGWFGDEALQIGAVFYDISIDNLNTIFHRNLKEDICRQLRDEAEFLAEGVYDRKRYEYYWTDEKLYVFSFFTIEREGESMFRDTEIIEWSFRNINPEEKGYTKVCEIGKSDKMKYDVLVMSSISENKLLLYIDNLSFRADRSIVRSLVYANDNVKVFDEEEFDDFSSKFKK